MIQFIDKGPGLIEAIEAAGHTLYRLDGEWVASDVAAVQAIIDSYQPEPDVALIDPDRLQKLLKAGFPTAQAEAILLALG